MLGGGGEGGGGGDVVWVWEMLRVRVGGGGPRQTAKKENEGGIAGGACARNGQRPAVRGKKARVYKQRQKKTARRVHTTGR